MIYKQINQLPMPLDTQALDLLQQTRFLICEERRMLFETNDINPARGNTMLNKQMNPNYIISSMYLSSTLNGMSLMFISLNAQNFLTSSLYVLSSSSNFFTNSLVINLSKYYATYFNFLNSGFLHFFKHLHVHVQCLKSFYNFETFRFFIYSFFISSFSS